MRASGVMKFFTNRTMLLLAVLVASLLIINGMAPGFINVENLLGITQFGAVILLLGMGQAIVMIAGGGGIDLSIGAMVSLAGVLFGVLSLQAGLPYAAAGALTIVISIGFGLLNGILVTALNLPAFIATLSTNYMFSSLALYLTNGVPLSGYEEGFAWIGQGMTLMIPNQVLFVAVPAVAVLLYAVNRTKYGRYLYSIGSNATAARFAGIHVERIRCANYMLNGVLAGVASIVMCSWLMTSRADAGAGYDLQSIAVVVLGGIAINGGSGRLSGVIVAVLITTIISTGIQYANLNGIWQLAVLGIILIVSVSVNQWMIFHAEKMSKRLQKQLIEKKETE